jgi:RNA polymerase sigma-70 factor (ECF subfamily)
VTPSHPLDAPLADWARRVRSGDIVAFELLFKHVHPMLTRVAGSIADTPLEAEDVVQETFVRLWEQRERLDPTQSVRAYLIQSVRNRALNGIRDERRRRELLAAHAGEVEAHTLPADDGTEADSLSDRLRSLLARLPERQRMALALTRFDGLSHAEAADAMGCSVRTVNNHIVRGLQTLRERLQATQLDGY